jgi:hypothetical protein
VLIKPSNSLKESLFLSILLLLLGEITSHRETVHDTTVQVDLIWLFGLDEDGLGLVALLGGEDLVSLSGGDGEGSADSGELGFFDESVGMRC